MNTPTSALRNSPEAWGNIAKFFHWVSALLILFLVGYGWWMTHLVERAGRLGHYRQHSVIGWYVLLFIALRLAWRAFNPGPLPPAELPRWERTTARAAHWTLYALLFVVSISGWMVADTFRQPIEATLFASSPCPTSSTRRTARCGGSSRKPTKHCLTSCSGWSSFTSQARYDIIS